jgi:hypothetical protein
MSVEDNDGGRCTKNTQSKLKKNNVKLTNLRISNRVHYQTELMARHINTLKKQVGIT